MNETQTVIFVCLGNICRSPMAENVMHQLVAAKGLSESILIDSAGTAGYHIGDPPHAGTRAILAEYGLPCTGRSRQISTADMHQPNTWIIALDESNKNDLLRLNDTHPKLFKLLEFSDSPLNPASLDVPDPYYTGDFETVYQLVTAGCAGLLNQMINGQ